MKRMGVLFFTLVITLSRWAQPVIKEIKLPNLPGFLTLTCDFQFSFALASSLETTIRLPAQSTANVSLFVNQTEPLKP